MDNRAQVNNLTIAELEQILGENLQRLRLLKNLSQKSLADQAGISVRALQSLEAGTGSSVKTMLSVVRSLNREAWLGTIAPAPTINPLTLTRRGYVRQRARQKKKATE